MPALRPKQQENRLSISGIYDSAPLVCDQVQINQEFTSFTAHYKSECCTMKRKWELFLKICTF